MLRHLALLCVLAMVGSAAIQAQVAAPPSSAPAAGDPELDKAIAQLKTDAEAFAAADDVKGPGSSPAMKKITYTADNVQAVVKALQAQYGPPLATMYVHYQLLQPMKMAGNEVLVRFRQPITGMFPRLQYKPMVTWPPSKLQALTAPPAGGDASKQIEMIQKIRQEKSNAEQALVKHNATVFAVETTLKELLAMLGDQGSDDLLIQRLTIEESGSLGTFETTLDIIRRQATDMKPQRAKFFYDRLKAMALRSGPRKKYLEPCKYTFNATGNSSFGVKDMYFCIPALTTINTLATAAKEAAVPVPDIKTLDARFAPPKKK